MDVHREDIDTTYVIRGSTFRMRQSRGPGYFATLGLLPLLVLSACTSTQSMQSLEGIYKNQQTRIIEDFNDRALIEKAENDESARNRLLNNLILLVDMNYYTQERNLQGRKSWADFGGSIAVLGINTVGAATGAGEISRAMNAISALIVGSKAAIDNNLLQNQSMLAIIAKMRANRATRFSMITASMQKSTSEYPLQAGLVDIGAYYSAGTLTNALQSIVASAGDQQVRANQATNEIRGLSEHIPD